jgi:hypothetical protein
MRRQAQRDRERMTLTRHVREAELDHVRLAVSSRQSQTSGLQRTISSMP